MLTRSQTEVMKVRELQNPKNTISLKCVSNLLYIFNMWLKATSSSLVRQDMKYSELMRGLKKPMAILAACCDCNCFVKLKTFWREVIPILPWTSSPRQPLESCQTSLDGKKSKMWTQLAKMDRPSVCSGEFSAPMISNRVHNVRLPELGGSLVVCKPPDIRWAGHISGRTMPRISNGPQNYYVDGRSWFPRNAPVSAAMLLLCAKIPWDWCPAIVQIPQDFYYCRFVDLGQSSSNLGCWICRKCQSKVIGVFTMGC